MTAEEARKISDENGVAGQWSERMRGLLLLIKKAALKGERSVCNRDYPGPRVAYMGYSERDELKKMGYDAWCDRVDEDIFSIKW